MNEAINQFNAAIISAGLTPPDSIIPDGKLYRFNTTGKRGDLTGWYTFHGDNIPAGAFGDWRQGFSQTWRADIGRKLTRAETEAHRARMQAAALVRDAELERTRLDAALKAQAIWIDATPAPAEHPYLLTKGIKAHGIGLHQGSLVIPMADHTGAIVSLQFILADGIKRFLPGGKKKGCFFLIGKTAGAVALAICEGYATGASIHEATGLPVAVAFDAGNLEPVAVAMRRSLPDLPLMICADDDHQTEGNPGLTKAKAAALSVGGLLAVPYFGKHRPEKATDFNDMHQSCGLDAVRCAMADLIELPSPEYQPAKNNALYAARMEA